MIGWAYRLRCEILELVLAKVKIKNNYQIKCCYCCLGITPNAQLLKKSAWPLHIIGVKVPHAARYNGGLNVMFKQ